MAGPGVGILGNFCQLLRHTRVKTTLCVLRTENMDDNYRREAMFETLNLPLGASFKHSDDKKIASVAGWVFHQCNEMFRELSVC